MQNTHLPEEIEGDGCQRPACQAHDDAAKNIRVVSATVPCNPDKNEQRREVDERHVHFGKLVGGHDRRRTHGGTLEILGVAEGEGDELNRHSPAGNKGKQNESEPPSVDDFCGLFLNVI